MRNTMEQNMKYGKERNARAGDTDGDADVVQT